jgi:hypothetical protein
MKTQTLSLLTLSLLALSFYSHSETKFFYGDSFSERIKENFDRFQTPYQLSEQEGHTYLSIDEEYDKQVKLLTQFEYPDNSYGTASFYLDSGEAVKGLNLLRELAADGNSEAILELGLIYTRGKIVQRDHVKAKEYYEEALSKGNLKALPNIAFIYEEGRGVKQDYQKAFSYFLQASKNGDVLSTCQVDRYIKQNLVKSSEVEVPKIPENMKRVCLSINAIYSE